MEGIKILKRPRLRKPYLVVAWPGMGEVAFKAASFLVEQLKAREFAALSPEDFFYLAGSAVKNGLLNAPELPQGRFFYWKNKEGEQDLIVFLSNAQPDLARAESYSKRIIQVARGFGVDTVVSFASMPQAIDHTQGSGVWFASTATELSNNLQKLKLNALAEGQISGMNGLFLSIAKREGLKGFCLLGEIPLYTIQIENPKASAAVLRVLAEILKIRLDLSGLAAQAQIMEAEINKLLDYLKLGSQVAGPIGEEDVEKIKKTLNQLTKLPISVKDRIEQLFKEVKSDISKAGQLKAELDKWNAYKEYEDRFLDLFKKRDEKNN
ncbi:MAG: PAC2 family protein [Candidatus Omnitrophica bacterium]|nr:PAC2 family protein [Candidatus Omnitrophota bacterium]